MRPKIPILGVRTTSLLPSQGYSQIKKTRSFACLPFILWNPHLLDAVRVPHPRNHLLHYVFHEDANSYYEAEDFTSKLRNYPLSIELRVGMVRHPSLNGYHESQVMVKIITYKTTFSLLIEVWSSVYNRHRSNVSLLS